jgi:hypothetical protein
VRPKNEDTYYISDDAANGVGFSSESLSDSGGSLPDEGPRGTKSKDGTTSYAMGGGGSSSSSSHQSSTATKKPCVGFYGVYDGHCGKQVSEVDSLPRSLFLSLVGLKYLSIPYVCHKIAYYTYA